MRFQNWQQKMWVVVCAGILLGTSACNQQTATTANTTSPATSNAHSDRQVVSDFADRVVIPTYQVFAQKAAQLATAIETFVQNPNEETLAAAQNAWRDARSPWEQSESFTFGPADSLGYDAAIDSWPVNETDLTAVLQSNDPLTVETIQKRQDTEKGFHAIEFLLFGTDNNKQVSDFNQRELEYLQALGKDFSRVANELVASWTKGVAGQPAYREVLASAGASNNSSYPTLSSGAAEIVQGMIDSLDEVANEKIGEPLAQQDTKLLESRFSFHTLEDLKSNVKGAENVYLGRFPAMNTNGKGISTAVAQVNPDLDARIKSQFQRSMTALESIPAPLETAIANPQAVPQIQTAQTTIDSLQQTLRQEVLPLVQN
ncbi:imelysin family protein [Chroococcidiopsis sp. TS-821]|uniref:imelysin family protein n=1 Tax=Chroococcidiopsis sp. TS-821 TaxID=1378066 RepID=UPI000CEDF9E5|nr:imelysin family protein [Chroococcidiopsis sp. TS-821]